MANTKEVKYVIDVETTGLDFRNETILELAAVRMEDGKITDKYSSLVNPMQNIRASSMRVHNISEDMILDAPPLELALPEFLDFVEDKPLIGHNVIFDYSFINIACLKVFGKELTNKRIDTLQMYKEVFPEETSHGLSALVKRFDVEIGTKHRALDDAYALAQVYERLRYHYEQKYRWQMSQLNNIRYLFERYLRLQSLVQNLQSEMGDLKSIFKIYFEEGGNPVEASTGELLTCSCKQSFSYDMESLRVVLDELNLFDKVVKLNTNLVDKIINHAMTDEYTKQRLLETRLDINEQANVIIQKPDRH